MKTTCPNCRQRLLHRAHLGVDGSGIVYTEVYACRGVYIFGRSAVPSPVRECPVETS